MIKSCVKVVTSHQTLAKIATTMRSCRAMLSKMTSQIAFTRGARSQSTLAVNFVLVRHGQTEANLAGLIDGQTDSVLTDLGCRQAEATGKALADVHFDGAVASDLPRAVATAEGILRANPAFKGDLRKCKLLRERNFGILDGTTVAEYAAHPEFDGWAGNFTPEGAETKEKVGERTNKFFGEFTRDVAAGLNCDAGIGVRNYLIVSHGVTIMAFARFLVAELNCRVPSGVEQNFYDLMVASNASISRFSMNLYIVDGSIAKVEDLNCHEVYSKKHLENVQ